MRFPISLAQPLSSILHSLKNIHFIGICGTAMGSVASALQARGYRVTGSDQNIYPPMSDFLDSRGIALSSPYAPENLPGDADLIVVGNAISRGNPELEEVLNRKLLYRSLPEVLREFFLRGRHNLVIAGTHGKTTTSSMVAWIFECAGRSPSYMIGGIPRNFGQGARLEDSPIFVIEGDEYDTAFFDKRSKFLHYLPETVIVNNIEFDHADIFPDLDAIKLSFQRLLNLVPLNGMAMLNADDPNVVEVGRTCPAPMVEIGFSENAAQRIEQYRLQGNSSHFHFLGHDFVLPMIGEFNVRNAAMAISSARFYGIDFPVIQKALTSFQGIKRRQEIRGEAGGVKVIDDFGHHPTAIRQTLQALRHQYNGARLVAFFEPRSNTTRRAVFQKQLPESLGLADVAIVAQVARLDQIDPSERLDPAQVMTDLQNAGTEAYYEPDTASIVDRARQVLKSGDIAVVFSNGGFDGLHDKLLAALRST